MKIPFCAFSEFKSVNMQNIFYNVHYPRLHYHDDHDDMHFAYYYHDIHYCMAYTLMLMYLDRLNHASDYKRTLKYFNGLIYIYIYIKSL